MVNVKELPEFSKDKQNLSAKYWSIEKDMERFVKVILEPEIKVRGLEVGQIHGSVRVENLGSEIIIPIFKFRHFRCEAMRGKGCRSGIRVIYAYDQDFDTYVLSQIYSHTGKDNMDMERILRYFNQSNGLYFSQMREKSSA